MLDQTGPAFAIVDGAPPGLALDPTTGTLSGTSETAGTSLIRIAASNDAGSATRAYSITAAPAAAPAAAGILNSDALDDIDD